MPAQRVARKKRGRGDPLAETMNRLEKELPPNLAKLVRQLRRSLRDLEKQIEKARAEGERRWGRFERQLRRELAAWIRRLERAVNPAKPPRKKAARRKAVQTRQP